MKSVVVPKQESTKCKLIKYIITSCLGSLYTGFNLSIFSLTLNSVNIIFCTKYKNNNVT